MATEFGDARDFYRLRVVKLDESGDLELEWRNDILWRKPPPDCPTEYDVWRVEAVRLEDEERRVVLGAFGDPEDAYALLSVADEDLTEMTKSQFEAAYFPGAEAAG